MPTTLRRLLWPVYVPSITYAAGTAALLPAQVVLALELGFTEGQVALLVAWLGAFAIVASLVAGQLVHAVGERTALVLTTGLGVAALLAVWVAVEVGVPWARWVLVAGLTANGLTQALWMIARSGLVADLAAPAERGRAMNLYGASQRVGGVAGPFVAAAVMALGGAVHVFVASAAIVVVAAAIMVHHLRRLPPPPSADPARQPEPRDPRALRALGLLGFGVLCLAAVRQGKDTLIPLWAAQGVGLPGHQVALVVGIASAMELVTFWPAGVALDRLGRRPVVVTCLLMVGLGLAVMPLFGGTAWFVAAAMVVGLGDGVGSGIVKTLGVDIAPERGRGRFLGWWQSIASVGSFVAPALATAVIAAASLGAALPAIGALGVVGAGWMAYWTPRFVPGPRTRPHGR